MGCERRPPLTESGAHLRWTRATPSFSVGAGWHICVDVLEYWLSGAPIGRIVGERAKEHGWHELRDAYAARA